MLIYDFQLNKEVSLVDAKCLNMGCYMPRPNPGTTQVGRSRNAKDKHWVCSTDYALKCKRRKETL